MKLAKRVAKLLAVTAVASTLGNVTVSSDGLLYAAETPGEQNEICEIEQDYTTAKSITVKAKTTSQSLSVKYKYSGDNDAKLEITFTSNPYKDETDAGKPVYQAECSIKFSEVNEESKQLSIPSEIVVEMENEDKYTYKVTKLKKVKDLNPIDSGGEFTFKIPDTVETIGDWAFDGCTNLKEVTIPNSVETIGEVAFHDCTSLKEVEIPNSVKTIGRWAFDGCTNLKEVTIPNSVETINDYAFQGCTALEKVEILESVAATTIGIHAFRGCKNLKEVALPNSVETIGKYAFDGCEKLEKVAIPTSVKTIEIRTFAGCKNLKEVEIPNSVETIKESAFNGCENLEVVEIPNSVKTIEKWAFWEVPIKTLVKSKGLKECEELKDIVNQIMKKSDGVILSYEEKNGEVVLESTYIGDDVKEIQIPGAINGKPVFLSPEFDKKVKISDNKSELKKLWKEIKELGLVEDNYTFDSWENLNNALDNAEQIIKDDDATKEDIENAYNALKDAKDGLKEDIHNETCVIEQDYTTEKSITVEAKTTSQSLSVKYENRKDKKDMLEITFTSEPYKNETGVEGKPVYQAECSIKFSEVNEESKQLSIPSEIVVEMENGDKYTYKVTKLKSVEQLEIIFHLDPEPYMEKFAFIIPDSVTTIGEEAFCDCVSLEKVEIPDSVTTIGNGAFWSCTSLEEVIIPDSVTTIGDGAFDDCTSLKEVKIPDSVATINVGAFWGCTSLEKVEILNSVKTIGDAAFRECTHLKEVKIPDSVTTIGKRAFQGCTSLEEVEIPDSVITIDDGAFYECTNLGKVKIPDSVKTINNGAFWGCTSLKKVEIPNSVATIGDIAFADCDGLTQVIIPDSVTKIGTDAFTGATIKTLIISKGLKECEGLEDIVKEVNDKSDGVILSYEEKNGEVVLESIYIGEDVKEIQIPGAINGKPVFLSSEFDKQVKISDNKSELKKLWKEIKELGLAEADSGENLNNAMDNAEQIIKDDDTTEEDIENAYNALKDAKEELEKSKLPEKDKSNEKDKLAKLVQEINNLNAKKYTATSWNNLQKILKEAQDILTQSEATDDAVSEVRMKLEQAKKKLKKKSSSTTNSSTDTSINTPDSSESQKPESKQDTKDTQETKSEDKVEDKKALTDELSTELLKTIEGKKAQLSTPYTKVKFDIMLNGKIQNLNSGIIVVKGRTMLPLREIASLLGAEVNYNEENKVAIVRKDNKVIELPIGMNFAVVNGNMMAIDSTDLTVISVLVDNTTYLPVRFIAEQLGFEVGFKDKTVTIEMKEEPIKSEEK